MLGKMFYLTIFSEYAAAIVYKNGTYATLPLDKEPDKRVLRKI